MDSSSSRGATPGADSFDGGSGGAVTPEFFSNGEPPQKMVKRRPSQQKRRHSQTGKENGPQTKKRARKGSKVDDGDSYDACMEQIAHHLKNYPPVQTVEPRLGNYHNACPIFGGGEIPKFGLEDDLMCGKLIVSEKGVRMPDEGDYYNVVPFGKEPPVPHIPKVNFTTKLFYKQEFDSAPERKPGPNSPDICYSSSPEPEPIISEKEGMQRPWADLEPDDSDEDDLYANADSEDKKPNPPKIIERPRSPCHDLVHPIAVKPKPRQMISMRDAKDMEQEHKRFEEDLAQAKKSNSTVQTNGSLSSLTMYLGGNGATKDALKAINGLTKILKIESHGDWVAKDSKGQTRETLKTKKRNGKEGEKDILGVLLAGVRLCRNCEKALYGSRVKQKTADLPFISKQEREDCREVYFCDSNCYFQFAIGRTGGGKASSVSNLDQLEKLQAQRQEEEKKKIKKEKEDCQDGPAARSSTAAAEPVTAAPAHKGNSYKMWTPALTQQKKYKRMNENELTQMMFQMGLTMMPGRDVEDERECLFCHLKGDAAADGPARLLNYDVNKWVHLNCALWSEEVYETVSGALVNVETALKNGTNSYCKICEKNGATVKCWKVRCTNYYHVGCATKDRAMFYKNKSVYCNQHIPKGEKDQELTTLAVYRRVYVERDENRQVAKVMTHGTDQHIMRIGALIFLSVGQLLPHQLRNFHTQDYIYPIGYKVVRYYWSTAQVNKRCPYVCSIAEQNGKPVFRITVDEGKESERTYSDSTAKGAWAPILAAIDKLRRTHDLVKVFPQYICGEDLFGLGEPNIVKVLESLPGIESLSDYTFKYGRNPLLELPLAVNPTGCARSEPKMRTLVKRVHNFQRTTAASGSSSSGQLGRLAKENVPTLIGLETTGPYSKNFVQSKSSQYRKMKTEWRQNVVLARSKIQGLGLYAARDLEKHQMIIEYIGEVIRSELTDIREKRYEAQNRGIYMFRLDEDRVLDATMSGGMARYINHCCSPNCVTECVEVDRDLHIIIFANRRIQRGEELCYDYKFDFEDDNRIPCLCGADNCRKWMN